MWKKEEILKIFKYRYLAPDITKFEIVAQIIPSFLFNFLLKWVKKIKNKKGKL